MSGTSAVRAIPLSSGGTVETAVGGTHGFGAEFQL